MDVVRDVAFAVMCAAVAVIPLLGALYRGERAEFLRRLRLLENSARDVG